MITYQGTEKRYKYNKDAAKALVDKLDGKIFGDFSAQEEVGLMATEIMDFIDGVKEEEIETTLERHETEEEAREYFGEEFITEWNNFLQEVEKDQCNVYIHGTNLTSGKSACRKGLSSGQASLDHTTISQSMPYGRENYDFPNFEQLLNWPHKNHKCLVILAVPYECFYKEGLWIDNKDNIIGHPGKYGITADFIAGYIDVNKKKIIRNPKYNRNHNYEGKIKDGLIFHERAYEDNDAYVKAMFEEKRTMEEESSHTHYESSKEEVLDIDTIMRELYMMLNVLSNIERDYITEKEKKDNVDIIILELNKLKKILPSLKTQAEWEEKIRLEKEQVANVIPADDVWDDGPGWDQEEDTKGGNTI